MVASVENTTVVGDNPSTSVSTVLISEAVTKKTKDGLWLSLSFYNVSKVSEEYSLSCYALKSPINKGGYYIHTFMLVNNDKKYKTLTMYQQDSKSRITLIKESKDNVFTKMPTTLSPNLKKSSISLDDGLKIMLQWDVVETSGQYGQENDIFCTNTFSIRGASNGEEDKKRKTRTA